MLQSNIVHIDCDYIIPQGKLVSKYSIYCKKNISVNDSMCPIIYLLKELRRKYTKKHPYK